MSENLFVIPCVGCGKDVNRPAEQKPFRPRELGYYVEKPNEKLGAPFVCSRGPFCKRCADIEVRK